MKGLIAILILFIIILSGCYTLESGNASLTQQDTINFILPLQAIDNDPANQTDISIRGIQDNGSGVNQLSANLDLNGTTLSGRAIWTASNTFNQIVNMNNGISGI